MRGPELASMESIASYVRALDCLWAVMWLVKGVSSHLGQLQDVGELIFAEDWNEMSLSSGVTSRLL